MDKKRAAVFSCGDDHGMGADRSGCSGGSRSGGSVPGGSVAGGFISRVSVSSAAADVCANGFHQGCPVPCKRRRLSHRAGHDRHSRIHGECGGYAAANGNRTAGHRESDSIRSTFLQRSLRGNLRFVDLGGGRFKAVISLKLPVVPKVSVMSSPTRLVIDLLKNYASKKALSLIIDNILKDTINNTSVLLQNRMNKDNVLVSWKRILKG